MKRMVFLLLAVLMLIVAPTMLLRAEAAEIVDSGTCGENLTWTLDDAGTLTISGTGAMEDYAFEPLWLGSHVYELYESETVTPWYSRQKSIVAVVVEDGVTAIGDRAFYNCTKLSSITIPDSVAGIGKDAFSGCTSLNKVEITDVVAWCKISFGDYDSNPLRYADGGLYINGKPITNVVLPNSVTAIPNGAFVNCSKLTSITLPDSVTSIGDDAFEDCTSLSSITLPDSVTSIGDYAFEDCTSLSSITIPESVTSIGRATFSNCTSLGSITIPHSVTSIDNFSFNGCTSLNKVEITDIGAWCKISFGNHSSNPLHCADSGLYINGKPITNVVIPEGVAAIPDGAFQNCIKLTSITLPNSITSIGDYAFNGCMSLSSVTLPEGVSNIGNYAFENCTSLSGLTLPESVVGIGYCAFYNCECLTTVHYGGSVAQKANISMGEANWDLTKTTWHYQCTGVNCRLSPFADVAEDAYYYAPILWAVEKSITTGMSENTFVPDGTCTRAQIVTFLWRANGSPKVGSTNPFTDVPADAWYTDAVLWAVEQGITTGTSATTFSPDAGCTRGQVATFLWRAEGKPASDAENIFTDITPDAYYYDAVLWAVANEITNGMGNGAFAPDATCTRGQIVTFLYRAMA